MKWESWDVYRRDSPARRFKEANKDKAPWSSVTVGLSLIPFGHSQANHHDCKHVVCASIVSQIAIGILGTAIIRAHPITSLLFFLPSQHQLNLANFFKYRDTRPSWVDTLPCMLYFLWHMVQLKAYDPPVKLWTATKSITSLHCFLFGRHCFK